MKSSLSSTPPRALRRQWPLQGCPPGGKRSSHPVPPIGAPRCSSVREGGGTPRRFQGGWVRSSQSHALRPLSCWRRAGGAGEAERGASGPDAAPKAPTLPFPARGAPERAGPPPAGWACGSFALPQTRGQCALGAVTDVGPPRPRALRAAALHASVTAPGQGRSDPDIPPSLGGRQQEAFDGTVIEEWGELCLWAAQRISFRCSVVLREELLRERIELIPQVSSKRMIYASQDKRIYIKENGFLL